MASIEANFRRRIDRTGEKHGLLTIIGRGEYVQGKQGKMLCLCECGNKKEVKYHDLKRGYTTSCGCRNKELASNRAKTHGESHRTPTYAVWANMIQRCTNPNTTHYNSYGGRGITVCERWLMSYENFKTDMGEKPDNMSLDRKDVNGNYVLSNCRWATTEEQASNTRFNTAVLHKKTGIFYESLAYACKAYNIKPSSLSYQLLNNKKSNFIKI